MASLIAQNRSMNDDRGEMTKYPIKRLEISIKNFIKVLSIALDRLQKHSINIKRLTALEDWPELHKEQVNATRTVQQITANIREIEKVRCQVNDEDLEQFDSRVSEVKTKAVTALDEFLVLLEGDVAAELSASPKSRGQVFECGTGDLAPMSQGGQLPTSTPTSSPLLPTHDTTTVQRQLGHHHSSNPYSTGNQDTIDNTVVEANSHQAPLLVTTNLHVIPENSEASASWEQLRENIEDLNELVHVFAENVEQQGETINCIEDNIDSAHANVVEGTSHLAVASKYKAAMFPAVGAVLGWVLGGPIGFVAGMKIGGLAAVTGGAVGYAGGRYIKKRQDKIVEMEMTKMSHNTPVPDMTEEDKTLPGTNSSTSSLLPSPSFLSSSSSSSSPSNQTATTKTDNDVEGGESSVAGVVNSVRGWFGGGKK